VRETPAADVGDERVFERLVKAAFAQRRKQLFNGLKAADLLPAGALAEVLEEAGIRPDLRAETLGLEDFARLSRLLTPRLPELPSDEERPQPEAE